MQSNRWLSVPTNIILACGNHSISPYPIFFFTPKLGTENKTSCQEISCYAAQSRRPSAKVPNDSRYKIFKQCKVNSAQNHIGLCESPCLSYNSGKSIQTLNPVLNCNIDWLWGPVILLFSTETLPGVKWSRCETDHSPVCSA
jgi:hypothetical protein